jgi:hypothetical protein
MNPETQLSRSIASVLRAMGHTVIRVQSGVVKVRGGWMRLADPGTPDLCLPFLPGWLEVKLPARTVGVTSKRKRAATKPNEAQREWHTKAAKAGVKVAVVRSASEAVDVIRRWQMEARGEEKP